MVDVLLYARDAVGTLCAGFVLALLLVGCTACQALRVYEADTYCMLVPAPTRTLRLLGWNHLLWCRLAIHLVSTPVPSLEHRRSGYVTSNPSSYVWPLLRCFDTEIDGWTVADDVVYRSPASTLYWIACACQPRTTAFLPRVGSIWCRMQRTAVTAVGPPLCSRSWCLG